MPIVQLYHRAVENAGSPFVYVSTYLPMLHYEYDCLSQCILESGLADYNKATCHRLHFTAHTINGRVTVGESVRDHKRVQYCHGRKL